MMTSRSDGVESFIVKDCSLKIDSNQKWKVFEEFCVKCWLDVGGVSELQSPEFLTMFGEELGLNVPGCATLDRVALQHGKVSQTL